MSAPEEFLNDVKPYARARMATLAKRTEWSDGFNFANIPSTKLDTTYHLELLDANELSNNQDNLIVEQPFILRIFRAATGNPKAAIDACLKDTKVIIDEFLKPQNRLTQPAIKNVKLNSVLVEKLNATNDNGLIGRIAFTALVIRSTR